MRKNNKETNKVRRRKTIPSNSQGTISRRKVTSANSNSPNNNYKKVSSKPKKRKKSNKGKIIGGFLGIVAVIGVICFALVKFDFIDLDILDGIFNKGDDLSKEVYCKEVSEENVKYDEGILYADNQLSLISKDGVKKRDIKKLAKEYDAEIVGYIEFTGDYQLELSEPKSFDELNSIVSELEADENVESASLYRVSKEDLSGGEISEDKRKASSNDDTIDTTMEPYYPNDPWKNSDWDENNPKDKNWGVEAIQAPRAWMYKSEMDYVKIGLIDSNVDENHEDLIFTKVWNSESEKDFDHGTHVAGTMAAVFDNVTGISGVCPKAVLYASAESNDTYIGLMNLKCSLARLILNDVKVINYSREYYYLTVAASINPSNVQEYTDFYRTELTSFLKKFINEGYDFLIVKSAGNENEDYYYRIDEDKPFGVEVYTLDKYSALSNNEKKEFKECKNINAENDIFANITDTEVKDRIIIVGSCYLETNPFLPKLYKFSKYSAYGDRVDVLAPGERVYSTLPNNKYGNLDGTSMAAPHVSGLAGMIWGINENLTAKQVKEIIIKTAITEVSNKDGLVKANMIDAGWAVNYAKMLKGEDKSSNNKGSFLCSVIDYNKYLQERDANNEEPMNSSILNDVNVFLLDENGNAVAKSKTNAWGEVSIFVEPGIYDVVFKKDGYESGILENIDIRSKDIVYKKVFMSKASEVTGKVVDKNGNSLEGATVTFRNNDVEKTTESNSNGDFSKELKYGTYTLVVSKEGYETKEININVNRSNIDLDGIALDKKQIQVKVNKESKKDSKDNKDSDGRYSREYALKYARKEVNENLIDMGEEFDFEYNGELCYFFGLIRSNGRGDYIYVGSETLKITNEKIVRMTEDPYN